MRATIIICCLGAASANNLTDPNVFERIAATVNSAGAGWTADPTAFGLFPTLSHVKQLCGTWLKGHPKWRDVGLPEYSPTSVATVPTSFDPRAQWPKCSIIGTVRNQAGCGSCWAFGSTESFESRRCAATGQDTEFSTDDTAACSEMDGCDGGQPSAANEWFVSSGVVTGAGYHQDVGCLSYVCPPCSRGLYPPACPTDQCSSKLSCTRSCNNADYTKSYSADKTFASSAFSVRSVSNIMNALMTGGPLAVAFTVYADFPTYKTGVYVQTSQQVLGGHAVSMQGWGVLSGTDYWLVKNSWTPKWGDAGYFKIKKGVNECGIESDVSGTKFKKLGEVVV